jgi:hypothetical protein
MLLQSADLERYSPGCIVQSKAFKETNACYLQPIRFSEQGMNWLICYHQSEFLQKKHKQRKRHEQNLLIRTLADPPEQKNQNNCYLFPS